MPYHHYYAEQRNLWSHPMQVNETAQARLAPQSKLHLHTQFSDYIDGRRRINPINVEISPCGICNASCEFCFYANTGELGEHRNVMLSYPILLSLLANCVYIGVKSISWTGGGEPSLYPKIAEAVDKCWEFGMEQGMFTNALSKPKYNPERMTWIRITMTDRPFNEEYIKELRPVKTLSVAFNWRGAEDYKYLRRTLDMAERLGLDYVQVRPALKFHGETTHIAPPTFVHPLLHITDYKFEQSQVKHSYKECEGYHFVPFVWEDGNVDVCSYMRKHSGYTLGNINKESFNTIMSRAPHSVPVIDKCQVCCRNHEINLAVYSARKLQDVNFP